MAEREKEGGPLPPMERIRVRLGERLEGSEGLPQLIRDALLEFVEASTAPSREAVLEALSRASEVPHE